MASLGWRILCRYRYVSLLRRAIDRCWSLLWRMLCHRCRDGFSSRRYFAVGLLWRMMLCRQGLALVSPIADALPPLMLDARLVLSGWMLFHRSYVFCVSNHCVSVSFFSQVSRLRFWAKGPTPLLL
jgi:hypothetical protein